MPDGCLSPNEYIDLDISASVAGSRALVATPKLSSDLSNGMQLRSGKGMWAPGRALVSSGSVMPSPENGMIADYRFSDGVFWAFRYDSTSGLANKWAFIGGNPAYANRVQQGTATVGGGDTWVDLSSSDQAGPDVTIPLTGNYRVRFGTKIQTAQTTSRGQVGVSIGAGNDPNVDNTASVYNAAGDNGSSAFNTIEISASAGTRLRLLYRDDGTGTAKFSQRWLEVAPARVQ